MSLFKQSMFLGTSSGCPTTFRNVSAYALHFTDGRAWLFDCGEGTQHQVIRSGGSIAAANPWMATTPSFQVSAMSLSKIDRIFITHLHGDHCYGLPGLMCSLSLLWQAPGVVGNATFFLARKGLKQQQKAAAEGGAMEEEEGAEEVEEGDMVYDHFSKTNQYLDLYGPPGLAGYIRGVLRVSEAGLGFQYRVHELVHPTTAHVASDPADHMPCEAPTVLIPCNGDSSSIDKALQAKGDAKKVDPAAPPTDALFWDITGATSPSAAPGQVTVHAAYLSHRVTSLGYVLTEPSTPGTLDIQKCLKAGVPKGPLLAALKRGEDVCVPKSDPPVTVKATDVIGLSIPGRTYIHLGDTSRSDNIATICSRMSPKGDEAPVRPDYLVHESTFDDATAILAEPRGHSTSRMAGAFACQLEVKDTLFLTHFSARYPPPHSATVNADGETPMTVLINQAKDEITKQRGSSGPKVVAGHDFMVIDLSKQKAAAAATAAVPSGEASSGSKKAKQQL